MRKISTLSLVYMTLAANAVVILQGAFVRATGSGAGCGSHWPTCNGEVIPLSHTVESSIEFSHRLLTLVVLYFGTWLLRRAWLERKENPGLWAGALASFVFLLIEAGLGALTVLWGLTGDNTTVARGLMVATHLVNSLLLVGSLSLTVMMARDRKLWPLNLAKQPLLTTVFGVALVSMLFLMFTGGIAAMGNTMFPSESLREGIAADFDTNSHPLIRLRILHPVIAIGIGVYLFVALGLGWWLKPVRSAKRLAQVLLGVYLVQMAVGTLNLALLAPVVLQLTHLMLAVVAFALLAALTTQALGSNEVETIVRPRPLSPVKEAR